MVYGPVDALAENDMDEFYVLLSPTTVSLHPTPTPTPTPRPLSPAQLDHCESTPNPNPIDTLQGYSDAATKAYALMLIWTLTSTPTASLLEADP